MTPVPAANDKDRRKASKTFWAGRYTNTFDVQALHNAFDSYFDEIGKELNINVFDAFNDNGTINTSTVDNILAKITKVYINGSSEKDFAAKALISAKSMQTNRAKYPTMNTVNTLALSPAQAQAQATAAATTASHLTTLQSFLQAHNLLDSWKYLIDYTATTVKYGPSRQSTSPLALLGVDSEDKLIDFIYKTGFVDGTGKSDNLIVMSALWFLYFGVMFDFWVTSLINHGNIAITVNKQRYDVLPTKYMLELVNPATADLLYGELKLRVVNHVRPSKRGAAKFELIFNINALLNTKRQSTIDDFDKTTWLVEPEAREATSTYNLGKLIKSFNNAYTEIPKFNLLAYTTLLESCLGQM